MRCERYPGEAFSFERALTILRRGHLVARRGWLGDYPMWVVLEDDGNFVRHFVAAFGRESYVWTPGRAEDLLTRDWYEVDRISTYALINGQLNSMGAGTWRKRQFETEAMKT